jgi:hypothetical protein
MEMTAGKLDKCCLLQLKIHADQDSTHRSQDHLKIMTTTHEIVDAIHRPTSRPDLHHHHVVHYLLSTSSLELEIQAESLPSIHNLYLPTGPVPWSRVSE